MAVVNEARNAIEPRINVLIVPENESACRTKNFYIAELFGIVVISEMRNSEPTS